MVALVGPRLRLGALIVVAVVVQNAVVDRLQLHRVHADLMLLLPILAGYLRGSEAGAVVGFFAGLGADIAAPTTLGLTSLAFVIVGFAVGAAHDSLLSGPWWISAATAAAGSALGVGIFVGLSVLTAQRIILHDSATVLGAVTFVSVANATLAAPAAVVMRWAIGSDRDGGVPA